jgi:hypothetical protein
MYDDFAELKRAAPPPRNTPKHKWLEQGNRFGSWENLRRRQLV